MDTGLTVGNLGRGERKLYIYSTSYMNQSVIWQNISQAG